MRRHAQVLLGALVLLSGCASSSPLPTGSTEASQKATPTSQPTPTAVPTPRPTPKPEGQLETVGELVLAWGSASHFVSYIVIVEMHNSGTGWAQLLPSQSDYTVLNGSGGVTVTGSFFHAYPEFIAPGETGYLLEDSLQDGGNAADFASVTADGRYNSVDPPAVTFEVAQVTWRKGANSDGLTATGFVTASGSYVTDAALAVFCLGANGEILGASSTNLLQNLADGVAKGFETVTVTPPLRASQCVTTVGYAEETGFQG